MGRLCPLVLALWAIVDVTLRLVPEEWFHVNPITVALRRPGLHSSFEPNFSAESSQYVGDAVREANLASTERRAALQFSTDALGYRRNPYLDGNAVDLLVLRGFSFVYGGALSDDETLPAALTRIAGFPAYNAARWHLDEFDSMRDLDWLLGQLPRRPRVAIVVYLEHENPDGPPRSPRRTRRAVSALPDFLAAPVQAADAAYGRARRLVRGISRWWEFSPLDIMATRLYRAIANDRVLPNRYREGGRQLTLPDGRSMIFREYEVAPARAERGPVEARRAVAYLEWWRDRLAERGLETLVLILPTRYTVYAPLLETGALQTQALQAVEYLDRVSTELTHRGILNINGARVFLARAATELLHGDLSFYREDNHWNPRGVERIARVLAETLRSRGESALPAPIADDEGADPFTLTPTGSPSDATPNGLGAVTIAPESTGG
jgi:hypothetical protein